jgi:hypothetical protein
VPARIAPCWDAPVSTARLGLGLAAVGHPAYLDLGTLPAGVALIAVATPG